MGDAGISVENNVKRVETRNFQREFDEASRVRQSVMAMAQEREGGAWGRRFTIQYLDSRAFPVDALNSFSVTGEIGEEEARRAREGAATLSLEAALQVIEAQPASRDVVEDLGSLERMGRTIGQAAGYMMMLEKADPETVISVTKKALEGRSKAGAPSLKDSETWSDEQVMQWSQDVFRHAGGRVGRAAQTLSAYLGR